MVELPDNQERGRQPETVAPLEQGGTRFSKIRAAMLAGILAIPQLSCIAQVDETKQTDQPGFESAEKEIRGLIQPSFLSDKESMSEWKVTGLYKEDFRLRIYQSSAHQKAIPSIEDCSLFFDEIVEVDENGNYNLTGETPDGTAWLRLKAFKENGEAIQIVGLDEELPPDGMVGLDYQGLPH